MNGPQSMSLHGKVCVVTGASRGIGKGIALQLGERGAKVYITGRTLDRSEDTGNLGSLRDTRNEIEDRGGECIPVKCDSRNDEELEKLFARVKRENDGRLDILVNNAFSAVDTIYDNMDTAFWKQPMNMWDDVNDVGLRSHYMCSIHAARLMVPRKTGLIVNISSRGGTRKSSNVPYGVTKEACDKMVAECAQQLREFNVSVVSLWPGDVGTENLVSIYTKKIAESKLNQTSCPKDKNNPKSSLKALLKGETPEFSGKCIASLANDPNILEKSGKVLMTCDLAREYSLQDIDQHKPTERRRVNAMLARAGYTITSMFVPDSLTIPKWMIALTDSKF